jgi:flagellar hook-associated protein 2
MAVDLSVSGLASGFDWKTLVDQLTEVERTPERQLQTTQSNLEQVNNAYGSLNTQLGVLKNRVDSLQDRYSAAICQQRRFDNNTANASDGATSWNLYAAFVLAVPPSKARTQPTTECYE